MNDLDLLRDLRSDLPDVDAERLAKLRAQVLREASRPGRSARAGRRPALRPVMAGAATLALLVSGLGTVALLEQDGGTRGNQARSTVAQPRMVSVSTVRWLERAATKVEKGQVRRPRPDQWIYIKEMSLSVAADGRATFPATEMWWRADGALAQYGDHPVEDAGLEGDDRSPLQFYDELARWPTDPEQLLAHVSKGGIGTEEGQARAFTELVVVLTDATQIPPRLHGTIYRALALIPGVEMEAAQDVAGRDAIAIGRPRNEAGGPDFPTRWDVLLDPHTYRLLGSRLVALEDVPDDTFHIGRVLNAGARLTTGVVDRPGERPVDRPSDRP